MEDMYRTVKGKLEHEYFYAVDWAIQVWRRFEEALFKPSDSTFFNGIPMREYHPEKIIYQQGSLTSLFGVQWDPIHPRCPCMNYFSILSNYTAELLDRGYVKLSLPFHEVCFIYLFIYL